MGLNAQAAMQHRAGCKRHPPPHRHCRRRRLSIGAFPACPKLPSSGREFVEQILPHFQRDNPQLAVETVVQRGKHPGLLGEFRESAACPRLPPLACCVLHASPHAAAWAHAL